MADMPTTNTGGANNPEDTVRIFVARLIVGGVPLETLHKAEDETRSALLGYDITTGEDDPFRKAGINIYASNTARNMMG